MHLYYYMSLKKIKEQREIFHAEKYQIYIGILP